MSLVLVNYKVKKFYQIIGVVGLWYGMAWSIPRGKLIFFEGGGGCFFQMMSDFFGFFPWVSNHAPSPRPHEPRPLATPRATTPRPCFLVRASPRLTESTSTSEYSSIASTTHAHTRKRSSR
jgi:hypothetical protein